MNIAIVGATGNVGRKTLEVFDKKNFRFDNLYLVASEKSAGKKILFRDKEYEIENLENYDFSKADITFFAAGGKNMIGPNLWNVIGRTAGSVSDYKYSKAMVAYAKEWSFEEMNSYLIKPQAYIKGTKMAFAGLRKEKDRASVILYMNSKGDNPKPLP